MNTLFTTKNAKSTKIGNMNFQILRVLRDLRGKNDFEEIYQ